MNIVTKSDCCKNTTIKSGNRTLRFGLSVALWFSLGTINAQNAAINKSATSPDASAILDLNSGNGWTSGTSKGLLIPNIALTGIHDNTTILSPATSLLVYNTATGGGVIPGYYYNANTPALPTWTAVGGSSDWLLLGNSGTTAGTNFVGTTDANDLVFKTNSTEDMRIAESNGNVGINEAAPKSKLDVNGNASIGTYAGVTAAPANGLTVSGQVGIGTATPTVGSALEVASTTEGVLIPRMPSAPTPVPVPTSLLYYDQTKACFMFYNGTGWQPISCVCNGIPATPTFTGATYVCPSTAGNVYNITSPTTGILYYNWTVPTGSTITAGQGTSSITVTFGTTIGNITVSATNSCGNSTAASLTLQERGYIPIQISSASTITSTTGSPFQLMVVVNSSTYSQYEMSGLQNVEFSTSPDDVNPLYAWVESGASSGSPSTVYWVNLGNMTITGGTPVDIYLNFLPTAIMANSGSYTGEAPQLSTPYAQYDNGPSIFTACYTAWGGLSGGSVPAGISTTAGGVSITNSTNYTQVTFTAGNNGSAHGVYYTSTPASVTTFPCVLESYVAMTGLYQWFGTGNGIEEGGDGVTLEYDQGFSSTYFGMKSNQGGAPNATVLTTATLTTSPVIWSLLMGSGTSLTAIQENYIQYMGVEAVAASPPTYFGYFGTTQNGGSNYEDIYWTRTRTYPPGGTMPTTAAVGSVQCW